MAWAASSGGEHPGARHVTQVLEEGPALSDYNPHVRVRAAPGVVSYLYTGNLGFLLFPPHHTLQFLFLLSW